MANVPRDIKKSEFISKVAADITSGATFDFVLNGTNYKVPFSELLKAVGSIGTLEQTGDATGVPVLQAVDITNKIRNIIGGAGILAALSPENGIQIKHNFTVDTTGAEILKDPTADSPTFRSLVAGSGIGIATNNGFIQVSYTGELPPTASNVVIVNTMDDFPAAVSGVRTLGDDTAYLVSANLSTGDRFEMGSNCVVYGTDSFVSSLEYTGSGTFFTSANKDSTIKQIGLNAASGTLLDISGTGVEQFQLVNVTASFDTLGSFSDMRLVVFDFFDFDITTDGASFSGAFGTFAMNFGNVAQNAGTYLDLGTATFFGFSFTNSIGNTAAGASLIEGQTDSGNITSGGLGTVINTRVLGDGDVSSTITPQDALWDFRASNSIPDSVDSILGSATAVPVTIAASDTPVAIGGAWNFTNESRFTGSGSTVTYTGKGASVKIDVNITATCGSSDEFRFWLYKDTGSGFTQIVDSDVSRFFEANDAGNLTIIWEESLKTGDALQVWVENLDGAANITIDRLKFRV